MVQALVRHSRLMALSGIASIAFGIIALVWPGLTFVALLALFGVYALFLGFFSVAAGLTFLAERQTSWVPFVLGGAAGIAIGAVTFLRPGITALALVYIIAAWAIITGVFEILAAFEFTGQLDGDWMLGLGGVLSVAFGVLVALYPRSGALSIIWLIGLYAILVGVTRVYVAYRLNSSGKEVRAGLQPSRGQS